MEAFFRGSHTTNFVTWGFNRSYSQAAEVPSSNVTCKSPRSPSKNCRIMLAFVSITHSITIFPEAFLTAIEILSLCTSIPIYLVLVIKGCSFLEGLSRTLKTYSKRGALYIALYVAKRARWVWIQSVRHVRLAHLGAHSFLRMRLTSRLPCRIRMMCMANET